MTTNPSARFTHSRFQWIQSRICLLMLDSFFIVVFPMTSAALEGKAPAPIKVKTEEMQPFGFSRLLVRPEGTYEISLANVEFDIMIIEELRNFGHNIVGAENLVFGVNESARAQMMLGGTISELKSEFNPIADTRQCRITITWQLFDIRKGQVVYEVETRHQGTMRPREKLTINHVHLLVKNALWSLMSRYHFVRMMRVQTTTNTGTNRFEKGHFKTCAGEVHKLPDDTAAVKEAIAIIRDGTIMGSGFFFSEDGMVMTAAHCIGNSRQVKIVTHGGIELDATVLRSDPDRDVAILKVAGNGFPCLPLEMTLPAEGSDVYALGNPLDEELAFTVTKGIVSAVRTLDNHPIIQTDAGVNPGNSGGPLLSETGRVLGVVTSKIVGVASEGIAFAVPVLNATASLSISAGDTTAIAASNVETNAAGAEGDLVVDWPDLEPGITDVGRKQYSREVTELKNRTGIGILSTIVGTGGLIAGAIILPVAIDGETATKIAGGVILGIGAVALAGGIALLIRTKKEKRQLMKRYKINTAILPAGDIPDTSLTFSYKF